LGYVMTVRRYSGSQYVVVVYSVDCPSSRALSRRGGEAVLGISVDLYSI
jgi:hypothetical protein